MYEIIYISSKDSSASFKKMFEPLGWLGKEGIFVDKVNKKCMTHQIILVGKDITSVYQGIKEFGPDYVHLLYTVETKEVAQPMYSLLPATIKYDCYLVEPYNGENIVAVCRHIHLNHTGDFAYNLSEGTKLMAMAAYTVAREQKAKAFYLTQLQELVWLDTFQIEPLHSTLENNEILELHGNKQSTYNDAKSLNQKDVDSSIQIKQFIEKYPEENERIQKFFGIFCKRYLDRLPQSKMFTNDLRFKQNNGTLFISLKERVLLRLPETNACHLYFEGRWWETLVANQVRLWSQNKDNPREIWQSVIFHSLRDKTQTKNEIDVLLNNEQNLIFIECKSGQVTQNDIYKIDAVRETYGGDISQASLVSYYPIDDGLKEKCKDLHINLFDPSFFAQRINHLNLLPRWLDKITEKVQI